MYTLHMIGLMYFFNPGGSRRRVLVPNGTSMGHYAAFFIQGADLASEKTNWWDGYQIKHEFNIEGRVAVVWEFLFPYDADPVISISGIDTGGGLDMADFEMKIPRLHRIDRLFDVDLDKAVTIGQMPISDGALRFFRFGEGGAAQMQVNHDSAIGVDADNGRRGGDVKHIELKQRGGFFGTEIVFSNAPRMLRTGAEPPVSGGHNLPIMSHFSIYGQLDKHHDGSRLHAPTYSDDTPDLDFTHDFLKYLARRLARFTPGPSCSPGCC